MQSIFFFIKKPIFWAWTAIAVFFVVAIPTSINFTTADEHFWLPNIGEERVLNYWRALLSGDWKNTQVNDKPGITLAYISGIAIPFTTHLYEKQRFDPENSKIVRYDPEITKIMNFAFRLPIILFIGFFSLYFVWILKRITKNETLSVTAVALMLLSPVLLGISQIVNPDTLFWIFGTATLLTFISYAQKPEHLTFLLTMLFFGLALASKYVAIVFIPFFLVILIIRYLFDADSLCKLGNAFSHRVRKDITSYFFILLGGTALFSLMMPATIADPEVLYESTIGFPGMMPIFIASITVSFFLLIDALLLHSKIVRFFLRYVGPKMPWVERVVYGLLLIIALFVLFNWISKNSLVDLSHIPYYAKTKASFTEDNSYIIRFVMEFVPLLFALTPITLFFLFLFWFRAFFLRTSYRMLTFIISVFFLIFYVAVVEQGLLVTVRYSIILFPLSILLATIALFDVMTKHDARSRWDQWAWQSSISISLLATVSILLVHHHQKAYFESQGVTEQIIGQYGLVIVPSLVLLAWFISGYTWKLLMAFERRFHRSMLVAGVTLTLFFSLLSLGKAYPHFFLYMNTFFPHEYVLNNPWGYGGYEAAQYLNSLPNAENITLWANSHGVCEFFVGNCIRSQKLDIKEYKVDYLFYAHRGALRAHFPTAEEGVVWEYFPDGRRINYVRLIKNNPERALKEQEEIEIMFR